MIAGPVRHACTYLAIFEHERTGIDDVDVIIFVHHDVFWLNISLAHSSHVQPRDLVHNLREMLQRQVEECRVFCTSYVRSIR